MAGGRGSSIAGICNDAPRHSDGSYTCAWEARFTATMLAHDPVVETRYDELARMVAVEKPPGAILQFRFSSGPDPGHAIAWHLNANAHGSPVLPDALGLDIRDYPCGETIDGANESTATTPGSMRQHTRTSPLIHSTTCMNSTASTPFRKTCANG